MDENNEGLIVIDPKQIALLQDESGALVIKKEAEESLIKLLELQKQLTEIIELVKGRIIEDGIKIDPTFRGVVGERVRASFRAFGEKYTYRNKEEARDYLYDKTYTKVNSALVDKYLKENGVLPKGIVEKDRVKSISFTVDESLTEEEQNEL